MEEPNFWHAYLEVLVEVLIQLQDGCYVATPVAYSRSMIAKGISTQDR